MPSFLDCWIAEAARLLGGELGKTVEIAAAAGEAAAPAEPLLRVASEAGSHTRCTVAIPEQALTALMVEAGDIAAEQGVDREFWQSLFGKVAQAAALAWSGKPGSESGPESAICQLRCGPVATTLSLLRTADSVGESDSRVRKAKVAPPVETDRGCSKGMELLLDVELEASLRFGSREMPLNEVLDLGPGDVVQLDRHISDPVDLIVGDKIVARGEVVLVSGNFALRVTEVAEPKKCLESIRCLF